MEEGEDSPGSGPDVEYAFIEMNPRIQVEHTVTEETTDVDLVHAQLRIAGGETLSDLGLVQEEIRQWGVAVQCRVTTEDPAQGFRPDTERISAYRSPGGAGIRLDGGNAHAGAEINPYFDSLLVKLTARGPDLVSAARRALAELRVRGASTNVAFLRAVLADQDFFSGRATTSFVDDRPQLTAASADADRASKLHAFDDAGNPVVEEVGELIITEPMPSMPLFFWGDEGGKRYRESYFDVYPGVWRYGDWILITTRGSVVIYGRSDSTINRYGVRMGTSEIYAAVEDLTDVLASLVVGTELPDGSCCMPLFVVLAEGAKLDESLKSTIQDKIRRDLTSRHIPDDIFAVPEIPRTLNGKKLEISVKKILMGVSAGEAVNLDSVGNLESIQYFSRVASEMASFGRNEK